MKVSIFSLIITNLIYNVYSAKILGVFPVAAGSHYALGSSLMLALAEKGHDVTFISPYKQKNLPKNGKYRDIILTGFSEEHEKIRKEMNVFERTGHHPIFVMPIMTQIVLKMTESTLNHTNVQNLINSKETFDVVIIEQLMNDALKGLASHFNASLITFSAIGANSWVNDMVANPSPISYIPEFMLTYSGDMTFFQRTINGFMHLFLTLTNVFYLFPKQAQLLRKYCPNAPDFYDIYYNSSLVLLNCHPSINQPVALVPNMIEIGGFHIKSPKKLPKDLQDYLDSSKDGVIYFSLGSHIKSRDLPPEKRNIFLKVFSKLKENVIWKWEDDDLPGKPENVKISKWLPQQDILAHPKIKLFITHGGLLSTIETVYHGVPTLTIPIMGDQMTNAARAANYGYALVIPFAEVTEEKLSEKINEMLRNSKFREMARLRSKIFHDQQVKPIDRATYWVEYIIRHGKAHHLKVAGLKLPWYKYHLLDVIAFSILLIIVINILLFLFIKKIWCGRTQTKLKRN